MEPNTQDYNEDELVAPTWMNDEFFEKVLKHCEKSVDIKLKSLKVTPASGKGDHFASIIFRATIDYSLEDEEKSRSLIIKTMPKSEGFKKDMLKDLVIFETEIAMYTELIPKFEAILRAAGDETKLGANCLYNSLSPEKLIVFEDIVPLGYEVMRDRQPNLEESKATYAKLAKWHAVSFKLGKEEPHTFDDYNNGLFMQKNITEAEVVRDGITNFIELLEANDDLRQYKRYFEPFVGKLIDECIKSFTEARKNPQEHGLYGVCHGDFHCKNLMFKHDLKTQKFCDVMLLDFQMCYYGPLVNDVIYSIYQLLDENVRRNHLDEILYYYFTTFQETLRKIGFQGDIPKILNFREQLMRHKILDIFLLVSFLPMAYIFFESVPDPEQILSNAEERKKMFANPNYLKEVRRLLPKFLYMGYLEN